jgi:hypothetical protein
MKAQVYYLDDFGEPDMEFSFNVPCVDNEFAFVTMMNDGLQNDLCIEGKGLNRKVRPDDYALVEGSVYVHDGDCFRLQNPKDSSYEGNSRLKEA